MFHLVDTSKALVTRSDALVPNSFLLLLVRHLLLLAWHLLLVASLHRVRQIEGRSFPRIRACGEMETPKFARNSGAHRTVK